MQILSARIKNFKAINDIKIDLTELNIIVGANGSGKSSILQALHWMFQSGRNPAVGTNKTGKGTTLSEKKATYIPSPDYKVAGHNKEYGNKSTAPQLDVTIAAVDDYGNRTDAHMWIKSARNEGLSVHVPSSNAFVTYLRSTDREFSAYIPGLAGIPLTEEKRSRLIVERLAAAGDSNTVLRNILLLLTEESINGRSGIEEVEKLVSGVMGNIKLKIEFDEKRDGDPHLRLI